MSNLYRLGIDEIAMRKGPENFLVVLVDLDSHKLIGMAESRKQEDVKQVLEGWGTEVLRQIVEVSIDLSGNSRGLVNKIQQSCRYHCGQISCDEAGEPRVKCGT